MKAAIYIWTAPSWLKRCQQRARPSFDALAKDCDLLKNRVGSVGSFQGMGKELSNEGNGTRRLKPTFSAVSARAVGIDAREQNAKLRKKTIADGKGHSDLRSFW